MGTSTDGILAYGLNLGGGEAEGGWQVLETSPWGGLLLSWWTEDDDDEADFAGKAEKVLLTAHGFTEPAPVKDYPAWLQRHNAAVTEMGVELTRYCMPGYPGWILSARTVTVARGNTVNVTDLVAPSRDRQRAWDTKIAWAMDTLGLTLKDDQAPGWHLASWWSG